MNEKPTIRLATIEDATAIAHIHVQAWHESYRGIVPDWAIDRFTPEKRLANWTKWLTHGDWFTYVAQLEGTAVGFACGFPDSTEPPFDAYLNTLYVLRRAQRRGIARLLLRAVAADLRAGGCSSMWWLTLKENPACAFYERIGAAVVRDQPAPQELGEHVVDRVFGLHPEAFARMAAG